MKLMIASDLHGSVACTERLLRRMDEENPKKLVLLGDLLYHGSRNVLPMRYDTARVAELLNARRSSLFCVRGNCDSEVDQMMLEIPILADYALLSEGTRLLFATHGHHFNPDTLPPLQRGSVLLYGHTHVPSWEVQDGIYCINPGSVSMPKGGSDRSYLVLDEEQFLWKRLEDGAVFRTWMLPGDREDR